METNRGKTNVSKDDIRVPEIQSGHVTVAQNQLAEEIETRRR